MSNLKFSIKGTSESATKFVAEARHFKIIIDESSFLESLMKVQIQ